ncbi:interactor of constitutive active ROPs 1-like [Iris pallida]|uniref:Interactor of constitutive active ROPs 1-like n=1 Tax=Iris pallida TaxID=29817 RepID=A0AAX6F653_IRIPA|nr:interactor of constitutive active ROPs 1-like [Iris pallida]
MPRPRGSEMPLRQQSPRVPLHLKTTACSESNGVLRHSFDTAARSMTTTVVARSPRSPLPQKKRGTRVANLETKLTQMQEELKRLKEQLASAEAAKKNAERELEETKKQIVGSTEVAHTEGEEEEHSAVTVEEATTGEKTDMLESLPSEESIDSQATDVFEVEPSALLETEPQPSDEADSYKEEEEEEEDSVVETKAMIEAAAKGREELPPRGDPEISELNAKLVEMEEVIETLAAESGSLRKQVEEANESATASKAKEEETESKLVRAEEELRGSRAKAELLGEQLEAAREANAALEAEARRLRVQTEQWRKAAEAAAAVLSGSGEWSLGGGGGFVGLPVTGGGEKKGGGSMRMFWKKAQK